MKKVFTFIFCFWAAAAFPQTQKWLWAESAGGQGADWLGPNGGKALATDPQGNVYIVGRFEDDSVRFGNFMLYNTVYPNSTNHNAFLVKYDSHGTVLWAKSIAGKGVSGKSVAVDKVGGIYVCGEFMDTAITIGNTTLPFIGGASYGNMYVAKYDTSGAVQWAVSGDNSTGATAIAVDHNNHVYIGGAFKDTISLAGSTFIGTGFNNSFIACMNAGTGAFAWAGGMTGDFSDITTDPKGNPIVVGSFSGSSMSFGNTVLTGSTGTGKDIFTAKYNASGVLQWAQAAGGQQSEVPAVVITDTSGNIFVGGNYNGSFSFGSTSFTFANTSANYSDGLILKYDSSGVPQWGIPFNGPDGEEITGLFVDKDNQLLIAGNFSSPSLTLGSTIALTRSAASQDAFIAGYDASGNVQWADKTDGQALSCRIVADTSGNIYLAGNLSQTLNFGIIGINISASNYLDVFLARYGLCAVSSLPQPATISGNNAVCNGGTYTYTVPPVPNAPVYNWSLPPGWIGNSSSNSITVVAGATGGAISVAAASNCDTSVAQTLNVTVNPSPTASIGDGAAVSFCDGSSFTLSANIATGYSYQWMINGNIIAGATNTTYSTSSPGNIQLIVSNGLCSDTSAITVVSMFPLPSPTIAQAGSVLSTPGGQGSYQWFRNAFPIPGATSNTYTVSQSGQYFVRVTDSNHCSGYSDTLLIPSLHVTGPEKGMLHVYPQPAKRCLYLETTTALQNPTVRIFNIQGGEIPFTIATHTGRHMTILISDVVPGIYFLSVKTGDEVYYKKVLLE